MTRSGSASPHRAARALRVGPPQLTALSPTTPEPTTSADADADADSAPSLTPIYLGVFTQMLSEGIAVGTLPLQMTRMGGSPLQVAAATSCQSTR